MSTHQVHVFISHSWAYSGVYEKLAEWVFTPNWSFGQASVNFFNFSVPKDDPIHNAPNDKQLREAITNQIKRSHVVVIPTGLYATHSKWINIEVEIAQAYNKPILAVDPWGQQRTAAVVTNAASARVGWNKDPFVKAIWDLYYHGLVA